MSFFEQILPWAIHHGKTLLFWLIWLTITSVAVLCLASAIRRVAAPTSNQATRRPTNLIPTWRRAGAPRVVAVLTFLVVFLACYIAMILMWEDFAYYDNSYFTQMTLKGHSFAMSINIDSVNGRFWPLGLQEFNLIRHFTDTITGYHALSIAQLLIFSLILLILDDELSIMARVALVMLALLTPSVLISFNGLVFPERNLLFFLTLLVLSVKRFEQTQFIAWAVAAVVSVQIMIYTKETMFLLLLSFAASRLVLRCRNSRPAGWSLDRLWVRDGRLDLCLASLAVLFLIVYLGFIGIPGNTNYAASARLPRADAVLGYTRVDLLPWLLVTVTLARVYLILRQRIAPLLLWDGLAVGGVTYFLSYLYLSIFGIYYVAPVDLIAILYVGRFAVMSWKKMRLWGKIAAALLTFVVLFQEVSASAFSVFERKNVIRAKAEIASVVKMQYRRGTGHDLKLFFPFSGGYELMEFGAYLSYRGLPVEAATDETSSLNGVVLNRGRIGKDGPCVKWTSITCHFVNEPAQGDLVIVLPDDEASLAAASVYRQRGELIFSYEPRPSIPHWLYWLFDNLHIGGESRYRFDTLPDRWMDASVTVWK